MFVLSNGGYVVVLVNLLSNFKVYYMVVLGIVFDVDIWLEIVEKCKGSWWEGWVQWCVVCSGECVFVFEVCGSVDYFLLVNVFGDYVL